jgi:hypothetical protein
VSLLLGKVAAGTATDFFGSGDTAAWKFTAAQSGNLKYLRALLGVANPGLTVARIAIYSDGGAAPNVPLGIANVDDIGQAKQAGEFQGTLASTVAVVAGTAYWLGVYATGEQVDLVGDAGSGNEAVGNMPNPWANAGAMAAVPVIYGLDTTANPDEVLSWPPNNGGAQPASGVAAWAAGAWQQLILAWPFDIALNQLEVKNPAAPALTTTFEALIEIGVGAAGSEVVVAQLPWTFRNVTAVGYLQGDPIDVALPEPRLISAGTRVAVRVSDSHTAALTYTGAKAMFREVAAGGQSVTSSGIASGEAWGAATVAQAVAPAGIASGEAWGSTTLTPGAVSVAPAGIASSEAFGSASVQFGAVSVAPTGIASSEAFGSATVAPGAVAASPAGIGSAEAVGAQTIQPGAVSIAPAGIASGEAFGSASIAKAITSAGAIASAEAFGSSTVVVVTTVAPTGIPSAQAFGATTVQPGAVSVTPTGIPSAQAFGATTAAPGAVSAAPAGIASGEAWAAPILTTGAQAAPAGIPSAEAFGTATVQRGAVTTAPAGIPSSEAFGAAIVARSVAPAGIASAEAFGAPALGRATAPAGIPSAEAFGSPSVQPGAVVATPAGIASSEAFGATTVEPPPAALVLLSIPSGEAFGAAVLSQPIAQPVSVAVIVSGEAWGSALVTAGLREFPTWPTGELVTAHTGHLDRGTSGQVEGEPQRRTGGQLAEAQTGHVQPPSAGKVWP